MNNFNFLLIANKEVPKGDIWDKILFKEFDEVSDLRELGEEYYQAVSKCLEYNLKKPYIFNSIALGEKRGKKLFKYLKKIARKHQLDKVITKISPQPEKTIWVDMSIDLDEVFG